MLTASDDLIELLASTREYRMVDLLTITTVGGEVLRYSLGDFKITWQGEDYGLDGPLFTRGDISVACGLAVDDMDLTIHTTDPTHLLNGVPFIKGIMQGALDGALIVVERLFYESWDVPPAGSLLKFSGRVSTTGGIGRWSASVKVASDVELLNTPIPRNVYTPNCSKNLYTAPCGVSKASFTVTDTVSSVLTNRVKFDSGLAQAEGYFNMGVVTFTTGLNAGKSRTVKSYLAGGIIEVALPWPADIAAGDAFSIYPGCDKTKDTCTSRFNNVIRFRGFPYIPAPETIT